VFRLDQNLKSPPGFFQTGSAVGAFPEVTSVRAFEARVPSEKSPQSNEQGKRSLISIFWKSRVYLDYSISTDQIGRTELAESSLQIWAKFSTCKMGLATSVKR